MVKYSESDLIVYFTGSNIAQLTSCVNKYSLITEAQICSTPPKKYIFKGA